MKKQDYKTYLIETEPAVKHLFSGLSKYDSVYYPSITDYTDSTGRVNMSKKEAEFVVKASENYLFYDFSRAILAGSILQVAFKYIELFSKNMRIPESCLEIGVNKNKTVKYCIGREIHNLPLGLYIYAGRNQYNHWEGGEELHTVTKNIFLQLQKTYYDDTMNDLIYFLGHPNIRPFAHFLIRFEFKWSNYEDYLTDMKVLLKRNEVG